MTAPLPTAVLYTSTLVYIFFDRAISVTGGQELAGVVVTDNGVPLVMTFDSVEDNALIATLPAPTEYAVAVTYSGSGTIVEAAAPNTPVAAFTKTAAAFPVTSPSAPLYAVAGIPSNDSVSIAFGEPVGSPSGDLLLGLSISINNVPVVMGDATASLSDNNTVLVITTGVSPGYGDTIKVEYSDAVGDLRTWDTGAVASFTFNTAFNLSTDGLPNSAYPLSFVLGQPLTIVNAAVTGTLHLYMNPIDRQLSTAYGAQVTTGGVFGVTLTRPEGFSVAGKTVSLVDGLILSQTFAGADVPSLVTAAEDWKTVVTQRIGTALGRIRALDQSLTLNGQTVTGV